MPACTGSIFFFIFRTRTAAYFFIQDVKFGGAKYIPTGRGYQLKHNSFVKVLCRGISDCLGTHEAAKLWRQTATTVADGGGNQPHENVLPLKTNVQ